MFSNHVPLKTAAIRLPDERRSTLDVFNPSSVKIAVPLPSVPWLTWTYIGELNVNLCLLLLEIDLSISCFL